jgi:hypothetical protein
MSIIQILLVIFFALAIIIAFYRYKNNDIKFLTLFYWIIFWLVGAVIVIMPDATFYFANKLGIGRGSDLIVYVSLAIVFLLIFRIMATTEKHKKEITDLTRAIALENKDKKI